MAPVRPWPAVIVATLSTFRDSDHVGQDVPGGGQGERCRGEDTVNARATRGVRCVFLCRCCGARGASVTHGGVTELRLVPLLPLVLITGILIAQGTRAPYLSPCFSFLDSAASSACAEQTGIELGAGYPGVSRSATGTRHGVVQVCAVLSSLSHLMHFLDVAPRMCCRSRMWPCVRTVASTHYAHRLAFRAAWGTPRLQN